MSEINAARAQLGVLSGAIVLSMAPWFAATVVAAPMAHELALSAAEVSWLTLAVQLGLVLGSLTSAVLVLSDRYRPRHLAAVCSVLAAASTAAIALFPLTGWLLSPMFAAAAMALSSVSVIGNALRLNTIKL